MKTNRFEVENKYRCEDLENLARRLEALGAERAAALDQEDLYFAHPCRDFRITDEAFRLRREGAANELTYKGPKRAGPTKIREEIEVPFESGASGWGRMSALVEALGFRPVARIAKVRSPFRLTWHSQAVSIGLDEVERLGRFVEIETIGAGEVELEAAEAAVVSLAERLGLARSQIERRSYLRMILGESDFPEASR